MSGWLRAGLLAVVFTLAGAFATSLWLEVRQESAAEETVPGVWEGRRIRIEVLNGAGVDGLARRITDRLRDRGFDVVYYGNASEFGRDSSVAIARTEELEPARRAAEALGFRRVARQPDEDLYLDVTVVLGLDLELEPAAGSNVDQPAGWEVWVERLRRAAVRLWPN